MASESIVLILRFNGTLRFEDGAPIYEGGYAKPMKVPVSASFQQLEDKVYRVMKCDRRQFQIRLSYNYPGERNLIVPVEDDETCLIMLEQCIQNTIYLFIEKEPVNSQTTVSTSMPPQVFPPSSSQIPSVFPLGMSQIPTSVSYMPQFYPMMPSISPINSAMTGMPPSMWSYQPWMSHTETSYGNVQTREVGQGSGLNQVPLIDPNSLPSYQYGPQDVNDPRHKQSDDINEEENEQPDVNDDIGGNVDEYDSSDSESDDRVMLNSLNIVNQITREEPDIWVDNAVVNNDNVEDEDIHFDGDIRWDNDIQWNLNEEWTNQTLTETITGDENVQNEWDMVPQLHEGDIFSTKEDLIASVSLWSIRRNVQYRTERSSTKKITLVCYRKEQCRWRLHGCSSKRAGGAWKITGHHRRAATAIAPPPPSPLFPFPSSSTSSPFLTTASNPPSSLHPPSISTQSLISAATTTIATRDQPFFLPKKKAS